MNNTTKKKFENIYFRAKGFSTICTVYLIFFHCNLLIAFSSKTTLIEQTVNDFFKDSKITMYPEKSVITEQKFKEIAPVLLLYALQNKKPHIRAHAALVFGESRAKYSTPYLIPLINDENEMVRECAFTALKQIWGDTLDLYKIQSSAYTPVLLTGGIIDYIFGWMVTFIPFIPLIFWIFKRDKSESDGLLKAHFGFSLLLMIMSSILINNLLFRSDLLTSSKIYVDNIPIYYYKTKFNTYKLLNSHDIYVGTFVKIQFGATIGLFIIYAFCRLMYLKKKYPNLSINEIFIKMIKN